MAKKSKKGPAQTIVELVDLAKQVGMPLDHLDGEIEDACDDAAELMKENVRSSTLYEQLEFLHLHGFHLDRLKQLIEESVRKDEPS